MNYNKLNDLKVKLIELFEDKALSLIDKKAMDADQQLVEKIVELADLSNKIVFNSAELSEEETNYLWSEIHSSVSQDL